MPRRQTSPPSVAPAARNPSPVTGHTDGPALPVCDRSGPMPCDDCTNNPRVSGVSNSALRSSTPARSVVCVAPPKSNCVQTSYRRQPASASILLMPCRSPTYSPLMPSPPMYITEALPVRRASLNNVSELQSAPNDSTFEYAVPVERPPVV